MLSIFSSLLCLSQSSCHTCDESSCLRAQRWQQVIFLAHIHTCARIKLVTPTWTHTLLLARGSLLCHPDRRYRYRVYSIVLLSDSASIEGCETLWHFGILTLPFVAWPFVWRFLLKSQPLFWVTNRCKMILCFRYLKLNFPLLLVFATVDGFLLALHSKHNWVWHVHTGKCYEQKEAPHWAAACC